MRKEIKPETAAKEQKDDDQIIGLLNSLAWQRRDVFDRLLQHPDIVKLINNVGGQHALLFLYDSFYKCFLLKRGDEVQEEYRRISLHTPRYPEEKLEHWKEPIDPLNPERRLHFTGHNLFLKNARLLAQFDDIYERIEQTIQEERIESEPLGMFQDLALIKAAFSFGCFGRFKLLFERLYNSEDTNNLIKVLENVELTSGLREDRFQTFIDLLRRLFQLPERVDEINFAYRNWQAFVLRPYRYISTWELSIRFLYYAVWKDLKKRSRNLASDETQLSLEIALDSSLEQYIRDTTEGLINEGLPVDIREILNPLRMDFVLSSEKELRQLYGELFSTSSADGVADSWQMHKSILSIFAPIVTDIDKIILEFHNQMKTNPGLTPQKGYSALLELTKNALIKRVTTNPDFLKEELISAYERCLPLNRETVLKLGAVDRVLTPIVLREQLYGLLVVEFHPFKLNIERFESLLNNLMVPVALSYGERQSEQRMATRILMRAMNHELRNYTQAVEGLFYKLTANEASPVELHEQVLKYNRATALTLDAYSSLWSRESTGEISLAKFRDTIKDTFSWRDYSIEVSYNATDMKLPAVTLAIVAELLRNAYKNNPVPATGRGGTPSTAQVDIFEENSHKVLRVTNPGKISPQKLRYLNNRDITKLPNSDFGTWVCAWLVKNFLTDAEITWNTSTEKVIVLITFK